MTFRRQLGEASISQNGVSRLEGDMKPGGISDRICEAFWKNGGLTRKPEKNH
jgi:hypothetical protein